MTEEVTEEKPKKYLYKVVSVEKAAAPEGMTGTWHRYVIKRGEAIIDGLQLGSLKKVTEHAETYAETLNERFVKSNYAYRAKTKK